MNIKKKLKVLHLASFSGNIGDVANHIGTRWMFQKHLDFELNFTDLEIREFYWKRKAFDKDFVKWANTFDFLLIGGGNYFELWVEHSETGTSIDLSSKLMSELTVPTVFYALGVDMGQGYTEASVDKFKFFITNILSRENMFICVRNDGSKKALYTIFGADISDKIQVMPDGGFFAASGLDVKSISRTEDIISINIAGDMLERRFNSDITSIEFIKDFAVFCVRVLDNDSNINIRFVPHIWRDVILVSELMSLIPDRYLRTRIEIASLNPTKAGIQEFLGSYYNSALVFGMRFHANVCPISMGVPTRALLNYPQVTLLYEELGQESRVRDVRQLGFAERLFDDFLEDYKKTEQIKANYLCINQKLNENAVNVLQSMNTWMHTCIE